MEEEGKSEKPVMILNRDERGNRQLIILNNPINHTKIEKGIDKLEIEKRHTDERENNKCITADSHKRIKLWIVVGALFLVFVLYNIYLR